MHEDQNKLKSLKVHWYSTRYKNTFANKYMFEMMEVSIAIGKRKRKKKVQSTCLLHLNDVNILVYDSKSGHLQKSTVI